MCYFFALLAGIILATGCGNDSETKMRLSGEVTGLRKGHLWLQKLNDTVFESVDSMVVDGNSNFVFTETITEPQVYYLTMSFQDSSNVIKRLPFFAEAGELTLETTLENFASDMKVSGSMNQQKWDDYKKLMKRYGDQNLELIELELNALKEGNDSMVGVIKKQQDRLLKNTYLASVNFAKNNNDFEIAPYLMLTEVFDLNLRFLDTVHASLTPKIKDSKYGKELESFIQSRRQD
ncbi:MAG: DUF4369 domain-containing protein [Bacteroidota bacterium]